MRELDCVPQRSPMVVSRLLDKEMILVHPVQGKVRVLNPVGTRVWELADGQRSLDDIIQTIAVEYQVDKTRVAGDVLAFCADLEQRGVFSFDH